MTISKQLETLAAILKNLQAPKAALKVFGRSPAEVRKAAHNAGRQAQRRVSKKANNYTDLYKQAYDTHCHKAGFRGKYETRAK